MEVHEKITKEEIKKRLEEIKNAACMYNDIVSEEKICVTGGKIWDVSEFFVCFYNQKHVGLFSKKDCCSGIYNHVFGAKYDACSIYYGVDSLYVGMKRIHQGYTSLNKWATCGDFVTLSSGNYVINCNMEDSMSFDDMRLIMYSNGEIGPYTVGKAADKEILDVLCYASKYFQAKKETFKEKTK